MLRDVEQQVNEVLLRDLEVRAFITTQEEARRLGAMALFGEKYGDEVRVVEVGDYARELCGGTHVARSGQLGLVKILSESSIGSGVRRVEALVGLDAFGFLAREHLLVSRLAELFRVPGDQVADRVEQTVAQLRDAEKELEKLRAQLVLAGAGALAGAGHATCAAWRTSAPRRRRAPPATTCGRWPRRSAARSIRRGRRWSRSPPAPAARRRWSSRSTRRRKARGLSAADLVKGALSGRGGGNADLAQGGGVPADQVPAPAAPRSEKAVAA